MPVVDTFSVTSGASTTASATQALTVPRAVAAGSSIILAALRSDNANPVGLASITDSRGNTWVLNDASALRTANEHVVISHSHLTTALQVGDTITVTWSAVSASRLGIIAHVATGLNTAVSAEASSGTSTTTGTNSGPNGSGTAATASTTAATTTAACLVVAAVAVSNTASLPGTPDSAYTAGTSVVTTVGTNDRGLVTEYRTTTTAGVQTAPFTLGTSSTWAEAVAAYPVATAPVTPPALRASTHVSVSSVATTTSLVLPTTGPGGAPAAGDVAVLSFFSSNPTVQTDPAGWTLRTVQSAPGIALNVWVKTLVAGDLGSTVTVTSNNTANNKRDLHVAIFSSGQIGDVQSALAPASATAHQTPSATAGSASALALVGVADRASPGSSQWTLPANLVPLEQAFGSGGGAVSSLTAWDDLVGSGSVGVNTVTGTVNTATAVMWTAILEPVGGTVAGAVTLGPDLIKDPWSPVSITATATGTPTSWAWTQLNSPPDPALVLSGANTATVSFTCPAAFATTQVFKLQAKATFANGSTAVGTISITVFPATEAVVAYSGAALVSLPSRKLLVL